MSPVRATAAEAPVHLALQLARPPASHSEGRWQARHYPLASPDRDGSQKPEMLALPPNAVVELTLDSGARRLVAAQDLPGLLRTTTQRGRHDSGPDAPLAVSATTELRLGSDPAPAQRDGARRWLLKSLQVYTGGPAAMTALAVAGTTQDALLEHRRGLYRIGPGGSLVAMERLPATEAPMLLFLHGTASSTAGSFGALWSNDSPGHAQAWAALMRQYGEHLYAFEHHTLTDSPVSNALALLQGLPTGARLHLVSHSRGGLVGELLARGNRVADRPDLPDATPFTDEERQRHAEDVRADAGAARADAEAEIENLDRLNAALLARKPVVERFVRVAAPLRGTTLMSGRLDRWASTLLNLLGGGLSLVPALQAPLALAAPMKEFLLAVVATRTEAGVLPGLAAMRPDAPLVRLLNAPGVTLSSPLHVLSGDFEGDDWLARLGDTLAESFFGGGTDLVVNTPSMTGGAARQPGLWCAPQAGPDVHHFSYFDRPASVALMLQALAGTPEGYERLDEPSRAHVARGGRRNRPLRNAPIALVLPGIMGSHLAVEGRRVWFSPLPMIFGGMQQLAVTDQGTSKNPVQADGWFDAAYEDWADHLARSHEVRPWAYDWRLSIEAAAEAFGPALDQALADARSRSQPLRIVAHSLGGLVARAALARNHRWQALRELPGSRLVQFGTPNQGSLSIAAVLTGRDPFVQKIERYLDWRHDMHEFLGLVRRFPGVLELLPWPGTPTAGGVDFFDPRTWQAWYDADAENRERPRQRGDGAYQPAEGAGDGWQPPDAAALAAARLAVTRLAALPLPADLVHCVCGHAPTPVALRFEPDGGMALAWVDEGDGRVPWAGSVPSGVPAWRVPASHGDLLSHEDAFEDYLQLLQSGQCRLPRLDVAAAALPAQRSMADLPFRPAPLHTGGLYPTADEVQAAALGARMRPRRRTPRLPRIRIRLVHGSLVQARHAVMVGAYLNDELQGSLKFLDRLMGRSLQRAQRLQRFPGQVGEAMAFLPASTAAGATGTVQGAVVIGLGPVGQLEPGALCRAITQGLLEYLRVQEQRQAAGPGQRLTVHLDTLLAGTGHAGLPVAAGAQALVAALTQVRKRLGEQAGDAVPVVRLGSVTVYEEEESRVIDAAQALAELGEDPQYAPAVDVTAQVQEGHGGYLRRGGSGHAAGWHHVSIVSQADDSLRFTLRSEQARNPVNDEPDQRQAVDGLIHAVTGQTADLPGLSRALFELLVPNALKPALSDLNGVVLSLDAKAACYPWELMRDAPAEVASPLATRIGLVRQLASPHGRDRVSVVSEPRVLLVGDTESGHSPLPGAEQEALRLDTLFRQHGHDTVPLLRPAAQSVIEQLFDGRYRALHLAAHGTVGTPESPGPTGVVLGPGTWLTPAQVRKLRHVPEVVFLNCCHLGNVAGDAQPRWGELAASLATQFIEMGCRAVVAAGWAVDDQAALVFATTFWQRMLQGASFGQAVRRAREATYQIAPTGNTWGAYQAYGAENFRFDVSGAADDWTPGPYLHVGQVLSDLDLLLARLRPADADDRALCRTRLARIEQALPGPMAQHGGVHERMARTWAELAGTPDDTQAAEARQRALDHLQVARTAPDGQLSMQGLQLRARLALAHGRQLCEDGHRTGQATLRDAGLDWLQQAVRQAELLEQLAPNTTRQPQAAECRAVLRRAQRRRLPAPPAPSPAPTSPTPQETP